VSNLLVKLVSMVSGIPDELVVLADGLPDALLVLGIIVQVVVDGLARCLQVSECAL